MQELTEIKGVGPVLAKACADNGYNSVEQIAAAMLRDLVAVPGISEAKAKLVIAAAQALLQKEPAADAEPASQKAAPEPVATIQEDERAKKPKAGKKKKKDEKKDKDKSKKKKKKKAKKKKKS